MPLYRDTGRCLGYAHIQFSSEAAVELACRLNGKSLKGRYLDVAPARSRDAKQSGRPRKPEGEVKTIFVKNIPYETREGQLEQIFSKYGRITGVRLGIDNQSGRCKGFAYVEFENAAAVDSAVAQANGKVFEGRRLIVVRTGKKGPIRALTREHRTMRLAWRGPATRGRPSGRTAREKVYTIANEYQLYIRANERDDLMPFVIGKQIEGRKLGDSLHRVLKGGTRRRR